MCELTKKLLKFQEKAISLHRKILKALVKHKLEKAKKLERKLISTLLKLKKKRGLHD